MIGTDPEVDELEAMFEEDIDDDLTHWVRECDPDTALCGEYVPGDCSFESDEEPPGPWCPECVAIDRAGDVEHVAGCMLCREGAL